MGEAFPGPTPAAFPSSSNVDVRTSSGERLRDARTTDSCASSNRSIVRTSIGAPGLICGAARSDPGPNGDMTGPGRVGLGGGREMGLLAGVFR